MKPNELHFGKGEFTSRELELLRARKRRVGVNAVGTVVEVIQTCPGYVLSSSWALLEVTAL